MRSGYTRSGQTVPPEVWWIVIRILMPFVLPLLLQWVAASTRKR